MIYNLPLAHYPQLLHFYLIICAANLSLVFIVTIVILQLLHGSALGLQRTIVRFENFSSMIAYMKLVKISSQFY